MLRPSVLPLLLLHSLIMENMANIAMLKRSFLGLSQIAVNVKIPIHKSSQFPQLPPHSWDSNGGYHAHLPWGVQLPLLYTLAKTFRLLLEEQRCCYPVVIPILPPLSFSCPMEACTQSPLSRGFAEPLQACLSAPSSASTQSCWNEGSYSDYSRLISIYYASGVAPY